MMFNKAYRFRIYPTQGQRVLLAQHFGSCRFTYNHFLRKRIDFYATNKKSEKVGLTLHDTSKMLTVLKKQPEYPWLNDTNSQSLQQSLRHLDVAYNRFFSKKATFPAFKSKHSKQSFHVPQRFRVDVEQGELHIPKFTPIRIVPHRDIEGTMKSVTISKVSSGKYFVSILCEIEQAVVSKKTGGTIGIDLGLKHFIVTSDGWKVDAPQVLRASQKALARLQRLHSRKKKGGRNRNKARIHVARCHEKISNRRSDFLHKLSHRLVSENQAIFAEDLNVKGMVRNHCLARSISDASWSEFIRQIHYKSQWNGASFGQVDRFFPSSKRCHFCGWINQTLTLNDRVWTCRECDHAIDRDVNAAQNILQFGLLQRTEGHSETQRPGRPRAMRRVAELGSPCL